MKIIARRPGNWVEAIVQGRWAQAKVFSEPSCFGINGGRVSKLAISKTDKRDRTQAFFPQICYSYDRGLDFSEIDSNLLDKIVEEFEQYGINNIG